MNNLLIRQLEELNPSEQQLVAEFIRQLLVKRERSDVSVTEQKRRLRASFGTIAAKASLTDESLRREYMYGEDGR